MANMSKTDLGGTTVTDLQPTAEVLTELLEAFREPDPNLDRIVELIAVQPSLRAEVLRRSNSVLYARSEPASDVFEAVCRIGMYGAYSAVVALTHSPQTAVIPPSRLFK